MKKFKPPVALKIIFSFFIVILIGTFFLSLPISSADGRWFSFVDSFFVSTSAVCVTGLTTVDLAVHFSLFGKIVVMLLIQIGGLGFVTISTLLFMAFGKKISFEHRLTIKESINKEDNQGVLKALIKIVIITFVTEFIGFVCLAPSLAIKYGFWDGCFKALFLSISAFCNSGMDLFGTADNPYAGMSVFSKNVLVLLPVMFLIIIGGVGFVVINDIIKKKNPKEKKRLSFHSVLVLCITGILVFGSAILFMIFEWNNPLTIGNMNFGQKLVNGFFQSVTPRTAGFSAINQAGLTSASKALTTVLMFIGGSPVSTAGGLKTTTMLVLLLYLFKMPNKNGGLVFRKKTISSSILHRSLKLFLIMLSTILLGSCLLVVIEGGNFGLSALMFEVVSAICTTGLTLGITPLLSVGSKLVLCMMMFMGRVGLLTFAMLFGRKNKNVEIEYQDSKIIVG